MPVERRCLDCNKIFSVPPSQVKRGGGKFCSIACGTRYRNKRDNPAWCPEVRKKINENHADEKTIPCMAEKGRFPLVGLMGEIL